MAKKPTAESVFARLKADAAQLERDDWQRLMQLIENDPALLGPSFRLTAMPIIWAKQKRSKAASGPRGSDGDAILDIAIANPKMKWKVIAHKFSMTEQQAINAAKRAAGRRGIPFPARPKRTTKRD